MLPGFPELSVAMENGRYICLYGATSLTFYSERSAARDLKQVTSLLDSAGDSIPVIVAPYTPALAPLFTSGRRFFFFALQKRKSAGGGREKRQTELIIGFL